MSPANGAHTGDQTQPIRRKNENENRRKEPKLSSTKVRPNEPLTDCVNPFSQQSPEILDSFRNRLHASRGKLRKDDQPHGKNPADDHGIADGETKRSRDVRRFLR